MPSPPRPRVSIFPSRVASQLALAEGLWRHHRDYWVIVGSPVPCNMKLMIAPGGGGGPVPDNFVVGIVDTDDPREIVSLLVDTEKRGVVERGPPPSESVRLNFYGVVAQRGGAAFQWNARKLSEIASSKGNRVLAVRSLPSAWWKGRCCCAREGTRRRRLSQARLAEKTATIQSSRFPRAATANTYPRVRCRS